MAGLTLLTDPGNFRAFKALIAAEYNGLEVSIPEFKLADRSTPAFLAKSPKVCAYPPADCTHLSPIARSEGAVVWSRMEAV